MHKGTLVDIWWGSLRGGPMALTEEMLARVEPELSPGGRAILKHVIQSFRDDHKWIEERTRAMRDEAERIEQIGKTMARAGLRSYTDEKGRIFVSAERIG